MTNSSATHADMATHLFRDPYAIVPRPSAPTRSLSKTPERPEVMLMLRGQPILTLPKALTKGGSLPGV